MSSLKWVEAIKQSLGWGYKRPAFVDGRQTFRIRCSLPVQVTPADGTTLAGQILNISSRGLKVELPSAVRRHDRVDVLLRSSGPPRASSPLREMKLVASVIWCRRRQGSSVYEAGLEIVELGRYRAADVLAFLRQELPSAPATGDDKQHRRSQRLTVRWPVSFNTPNSKKYNGMVKDVSRRGVLILSREPLPSWSELSIAIHLDNLVHPIRAHGYVRRCTKVLGEEWWEIASPLLEMTEEDKAHLEAVLEQRMKHMGKD